MVNYIGKNIISKFDVFFELLKRKIHRITQILLFTMFIFKYEHKKGIEKGNYFFFRCKNQICDFDITSDRFKPTYSDVKSSIITKGGRNTKKNYLNSTTIYQDAERRFRELCRIAQIIEKRILKYPPGKIHVVMHKGNAQYYLREDPRDKSGKYMPKKEGKKIRQYLQKKYDEEALRLINQEIIILKKYLLKSKMSSETIQSLYSSQPQEIKQMLNPIAISDSDFVSEWLLAPYEPKTIDKENCRFKTDRGEIVRSKSEVNIANALNKFNIPYKYECPLCLSNGVVIHPDFTVLDIRRRREIYWEHRGMMDDREYARHTVQRLKQMEKEGIFPGDNLIITEETISNPLGTEEIEFMIKHFFFSIEM